MALDVGVAFVVNRWDFGVGVGGIANRINWTQIERHHVTLVSFFGGTEFVHVKLPVTERGASTRAAGHLYRRCRISQGKVVSSHGVSRTVYMANQFRAGLEYRLGAVELRGAGRYYDGSWYPSAGAGFNLTRNFGIDAALFGTKTFLERSPHLGLAISFRFDKR